MATLHINQNTTVMQSIGETAGRVWHTLERDGPLKLTTLQRRMEVPPALLHMALGWLAREDKVEVIGDGRGFSARLR